MKRSTISVALVALACACGNDSTKPLQNNETNNANNQNNANNGADAGDNNASDMDVTDEGPNNVNNPAGDMDQPDFPDTPTDFSLAIDCADSVADVYATPVSDGAPGEVLACAPSESADVADVELRLLGIEGLNIQTGYDSFLIAYRTTRANGDPGVASMLLYVPQENVRDVNNSALVVANHGGASVPDACAPSMVEHGFSGTNAIALPWVGEGYPVALPDLTGLGTEGVMSFGNVPDIGQSALDAARAAQNALVFGAVDGRVLAVGQGEGGRTSYAMQALAASYAPEIQFLGAIGFATSYSRVSYAELLRAGGIFPLVDGIGATRAIATLIAYTDFYNLFGEARARDVFVPEIRDHVGDAVESECLLELAITLATDTADYQPPGIIAQLIEATFRQEVVDCLNGQACSADAQAFVDRAAQSVQPLDPNGGDLLFISAFGGERPNPQDQACLLEWIEEDGPTPTSCLWSGANNLDIARQSAAYAVEWGIATMEGQAQPVCPESDFPPCE